MARSPVRRRSAGDRGHGGGTWTPERKARLRPAGFADPGRSRNYARRYPADEFSDVLIARGLLTILYDVFGNNGADKRKVATEEHPGKREA